MIRIKLDDATRDELEALRRTASRPRSATASRWSPSPMPAGRRRGSPRTSAATPRPSATCSAPSWPAAPRPSTRSAAGRPPTSQRRDRVADALRELLGEDRTWTSRQLSRGPRRAGHRPGPRQVRRHLKRLKAGYRRTACTLKHKQDPAKAERAGRVLVNLKAKAAAGRLALYYLDECGFSPTLPAAYSWALPGRRKLVRVRGPAGPAGQRPGRLPPLRPARRGWRSSRPSGRGTRTTCWASSRRCRGRRSRGWWCWTTPACTRARSSAVPGGTLAAAGIYLYFLPPYSPELNEIEPVFRQVKYQEIPVRSHTTRAGLREAVEGGFGGYRRRLRRKSPGRLRPAA